MRKEYIRLLMAVLVCSCCLAACRKTEGEVETEVAVETEETADTEVAAETEETADTETVFGEFEALTMDGETVTQEIFADVDVTMVNIWATYCSPCIGEMPALGELGRDYADKGLQIIGVVADAEAVGDETALEVIEKTGADFMHMLPSQSLYDNYLNQVRGVPTTVFVDSQGKELGTYTGSRGKKLWKDIIEEMLRQAADEKADSSSDGRIGTGRAVL